MELKNDLAISGTLHSVDQYLNVKLNNVRVINEQKYPHMVWFSSARSNSCQLQLVGPLKTSSLQMSVKNCFIRGSVVRYVQVSMCLFFVLTY